MGSIIKTVMQNKLYTIVLMLLFFASSAQAQVTIGSQYGPKKGVLLDLRQNADGHSSRGLAMPRVELHSLSKLIIGENDYSNLGKEHTGLMVYNMTKREEKDRLCPGLHVWSGTEWKPLTPYPVWESKLELKKDKLNSFTFLDPSDPAGWPKDKTPSNYPLGYIGTFTDIRNGDQPQTYNYTRFYVGIANRTRSYIATVSYSCDPNNPNYVTGEEIENPPYDVFEDGVWMNDNLRATKYDNKRDKEGEEIKDIIGPEYNKNNSNTLLAWAYPNASNIKPEDGLLYTWATITNSKGGEDGLAGAEEGGLDEGGQIQGICPKGWHLPSDRQWTDLENAIILNTSKFANQNDIGGALVEYDSDGMHTQQHGKAMKTKSYGYSGTSKEPNLGGFNMMPIGHTHNGSVILYGREGHYWTSSSNTDAKEAVWSRFITMFSPNISRTSGNFRYRMHAVRCKKNTD